MIEIKDTIKTLRVRVELDMLTTEKIRAYSHFAAAANVAVLSVALFSGLGMVRKEYGEACLK
jgi:hypothetical protein